LSSIAMTAPARPTNRALFQVRLAGIWIALYSVAFAALMVIDSGPPGTLRTLDALGLLFGPVALVPMCFGVWPVRAGEAADRTRKLVPVLLGLGVLTDAVGQCIWTYYSEFRHGMLPYPSIADGFYLASYPIWLAAILLMRRSRSSKPSSLRNAVDACVVLVAAFTFSWYFILAPRLSSHQPLLTRAIGVAYPMGDILLVAGILLLLGSFNLPGRVSWSFALCVGLVGIVSADSYFDLQLLHGAGPAGRVVNVLWPLGDMLVAFAAILLQAAGPDDIETHPKPLSLQARMTRLVMPYTLVPVVALVLVQATILHYNKRYVGGVVIGAIIIVALVLIRQMIALVENGRLSNQLQDKIGELAAVNDKLSEMASSDPLTHLPNHRSMVATLDLELERAARYDRPLGVLFMDIDRFKSVNDTFGHRIGDVALRELSHRARAAVRTVDYVGRWGGEEFIAVLPETDNEGAVVVAERVRAAIAELRFASEPDMKITCSIGIAMFPDDANDADDLIALADEAMYAAKWLGRNQVRSISDPSTQAVASQRSIAERGDEATISSTVEALAGLVDARDHYTGLHAADVASLARRLAGILGLSWEECAMIDMAGRLHDIGKVAIPDEILLKPGKLTAMEWDLMKTHPGVGGDVLSRIPKLRSLAPMVRGHHERFDGGGYPDGLVGQEIPIGSRILSVADAYSAMTTNRPYRKAILETEALAEMRRCAGSQFDPSVVDALEHLVSGPTASLLAS
jgi:two-component system cell cycle response regulator